jgi:hypothetical protein
MQRNGMPIEVEYDDGTGGIKKKAHLDGTHWTTAEGGLLIQDKDGTGIATYHPERWISVQIAATASPM